MIEVIVQKKSLQDTLGDDYVVVSESREETGSNFVYESVVIPFTEPDNQLQLRYEIEKSLRTPLVEQMAIDRAAYLVRNYYNPLSLENELKEMIDEASTGR